MMDRSSDSDSGFTLVEVLVAFTVLAVTLIALVNVFGTGFRGVDSARGKVMALQLAQSKLATEMASVHHEEEERSGRFDDRFTWRVRTVRHVAPDLVPLHRIGAMWVHVDVSWAGRRAGSTQTLTLSSLKVVPLEDE